MHHFLHFDYVMRLTPFDFLEVKCLNFYIFMSYVDARTYVMFNRSMDANYLDGEEENGHHLFRRMVKPFHLFRRLVKSFHIFRRSVKPFHFLGGWSSHSTFLGCQSSLFTF